MKRMILACLLVLSCLAPAMAQSPQELMQSLQKRYGQVQSIRADFERHSTFVAMAGQNAREVVGKGLMLWARPLNLMLTESEPRPQQVITDGESMWLVQPRRKRVTIYAVGGSTQALRGLLAAISGLSQLDGSFKAVAPKDDEKPGDGLVALALEPAQPRSDMARLLVWFSADDLTLAGVRIISLVGDVTEYRLSNVQLDAPVDKAAFAYQPPQGYRVVDQRPVRPRGEGGVK